MCAHSTPQEEATWSDDEGDGEGGGGADQSMPDAGAAPAPDHHTHSHQHHQQQQQEEQGAAGSGGEGVDPAYISIFLLKYVCPEAGCHGTLAPAAPAAQLFECSMCSARRSEAEFLAELEAAA